MLLTVFKITLINTYRTLFQNTLIFESKVLIKRSFIFIFLGSLIPLKNSFNFSTIDIFTFKCITLTFFSTFSVKCVLMKTSVICKLRILIMCILVLGLVINKVSLIKWSIREDKNWRTLWFSLFKVRNYKRSIFFKKFSISRWSINLNFIYFLLNQLDPHKILHHIV